MKAFLIPALASCLAIASCGADNTDALAQAQVDSIVASKTSLLQSRMKHNNDSIINAMAVARADSMMGKKAALPKRESAAVQ